MKEGGGGEGDVKAAEEKLKRLRKRNAELVALARMLDDKIKSLKVENEQLVRVILSQAKHAHQPTCSGSMHLYTTKCLII